MPMVRPSVYSPDQVLERRLAPGDIVAGGESLLTGTITTVGSGTWTAAAIATGIIYRTGPTGAFTDTTDTAQNIISALAGNGWSADYLKGTTFRLTFVNTVAFAHTFAGGTGILTGSGVVNAAASTWREYLVTILSAFPTNIFMANTTNSSAVVTFSLPLNITSIPFLGSNGLLGDIPGDLVGATVTGTGINAGTTVIGVTQGIGGVIGITLSAAATATNTNVALTFGPTVKIDGLRSGTL